MSAKGSQPSGQHPLGDEVDFAQSAAGEEDPGASLDLTISRASAASSDQPTGARTGQAAGSPPMSPGDEAPAGTPGTGEDVCPECGGTGQRAGGPCPACQGTGKVTVGIGGA